jgi:hypothetical protein
MKSSHLFPTSFFCGRILIAPPGSRRNAGGTNRRSMPPGFGPAHPGGMSENSPAFQRWGSRSSGSSPEGTAELPVRRPSLGTYGIKRPYPALKHWAIVSCPLRDIHVQRSGILVALSADACATWRGRIGCGLARHPACNLLVNRNAGGIKRRPFSVSHLYAN